MVGPVESYYRAFGYRDLDTSRWNTMENVVTRFDVTFNSYLTLNRISFLSAIGSALRRFRLRVICLEANARLSFFSNLFFLFPFFQNRNPRRLIDSSFFFFLFFSQSSSVFPRRDGSDGGSSNRSRPPMAAASFPPNFTNVGVIENW